MGKQVVILDKRGKIEAVADGDTWLVVNVRGKMTTCRAKDVNAMRQDEGLFPTLPENLGQHLDKRAKADAKAQSDNAKKQKDLEWQRYRPLKNYDGRSRPVETVPGRTTSRHESDVERERQFAYSRAAYEDRKYNKFLQDLGVAILVIAFILMAFGSIG